MTQRTPKWFYLVAALAAVAMTLGVWGYRSLPAAVEIPLRPTEPMSWSDAIYRALQLFVLNREDAPGSIPGQLHWARFLAPLTTLGGVWLFLDALPRRLRLYRRRISKGHHIVCGLGEKGMVTVRENAKDAIAIERDGDAADLPTLDALGVPLLRGSATDRAVLIAAGIARAGHVTVACGDDDEDVRIARLVITTRVERFAALCQKQLGIGSLEPNMNWPGQAAPNHSVAAAPQGSEAEVVRLAPHLDDAEARDLFHRHVAAWNRTLDEASRRLGAKGVRHTRLRFEYANYCHQERAARDLFVALPLDREPIAFGSRSYPHLILIGFGRMGQAVARQAMHIAHYPNWEPLRIDIFDSHVDRLWRHFCGRHPNFDDESLLPIATIERHDGNVIDSIHLNKIAEIVNRPNGQVTIVVAVDTETEATLILAHLPQVIAERDVPVCVRVASRGGLAELMEHPPAAAPGEPAPRKRPRVHTFGYTTAPWAAPGAEDRDALARLLHENFRSLYAKNPATKRSHLPWEQLDEEFRDSNRRAADLIPAMFRSLGYKIVPSAGAQCALATSDPRLNAMVHFMKQVEHNRWYAERYLAGWTRPDPTDLARASANGADPDTVAAQAFARGQHASLDAWHNLPDTEKEKDVKQVQSYVDLLGRIGKSVVPI